MNELITISEKQIGDGMIQTVNARDLHEFLGVKKRFSDWIKKQIERARLVESRDFLVNPLKGINPEGGRPAIEYHLTLDAGKHISMMSGCDKGFEVRDYFIECERKALQAPQAPQDPMQVLNDPTAMRCLLLTYSEKVLALEETITHQQPKVAALDRLCTADGMTCITDAAKALQVRPKDLFTWLSMHQWIYRRAGGKDWIAYQTRLQQGLLAHKVFLITHSDGSEQTSERVLVTAKGLAKLSSVFSMSIGLRESQLQ